MLEKRFEWLQLDLLDEAEIGLEAIYEALGGGGVPLATAGPVGGPVGLEAVDRLEGVLDGLVGEVVGAGGADAVDDAVPGLVGREEAVAEVHVHPVVPMELVVSARGGVLIPACQGSGGGGGDVDLGEGGELRAGPQALQLAELVVDNELSPGSGDGGCACEVGGVVEHGEDGDGGVGAQVVDEIRRRRRRGGGGAWGGILHVHGSGRPSASLVG